MREADLVSMLATDLRVNDYIRVMAANTSRKMTVDQFMNYIVADPNFQTILDLAVQESVSDISAPVDGDTVYELIDDYLAYRGDAIAGAGHNDAVWRIQLIEIDAVTGDVTITHPNADVSYIYTWNDRLSYTYS